MPTPIYYPETTEEQRIQLFNLWETTGDVTAACTELKVSRATFYYWKNAFTQGGYYALKSDPVNSTASPVEQSTVPQPLADAIHSLKAENPLWGKWQILRALRTVRPYDAHLTIDTIRYVLGEPLLS